MVVAVAQRGLRIDGLRVAYGAQTVLDQISVRCGPGEVLGLIGPNGAGKSTLLKAIVGLAPRLSGSITLDGEPVDRARQARIAYVPQRSEVDWSFPINVEEVVLLGRQGRLGLFGRPGRRDREIALAALERLGMVDQRRRQIGELSGGQQQRVFLARALAQQGDVLLLDEPLSGVDVPTQEIVHELLGELRRDHQAILLSTHDLGQAAHICDELCLMYRRVLADGPPNEVLAPEVLARAYGGLLGLSWSNPPGQIAPGHHRPGTSAGA